LSPTPPEVDPVLAPYLQAPDDDGARLRLGELLERTARPIAWDVIRGHLRATSGGEQEDVLGGILLSLAAHLRAVREEPLEREPIRSFAGYVAATAHHACHAFHRARFPLRAQLRSRTRYVLTRDPALALWDAASREWLCGTAAQRGAAWDRRASALLSERSGRMGAFPSFPDLVRALLDGLPGPARFEDLVDALAAVQGIIELFPATETATIAELAAALETTAEELGALWDGLPRDDAWIAERLGVTRRQVINLRKCARERLARRVRREGW
jgi:hypothetical protein